MFLVLFGKQSLLLPVLMDQGVPQSFCVLLGRHITRIKKNPAGF